MQYYELKRQHSMQFYELKRQHSMQYYELKRQHSMQYYELKRQHSMQYCELKRQDTAIFHATACSNRWREPIKLLVCSNRELSLKQLHEKLHSVLWLLKTMFDNLKNDKLLWKHEEFGLIRHQQQHVRTPDWLKLQTPSRRILRTHFPHTKGPMPLRFIHIYTIYIYIFSVVRKLGTFKL